MLKKLSLLSALAVAMLFTACGGGVFSSDVTLEIDNAMDTTVVVTINEDTYTLAADSTVSVSYPTGTYKLMAKTVTDSVLHDTEFSLEDKGDAILNLASVEYVIEYIYYSTSDNFAALDAYTFKHDTMEFEGVRAEPVGSSSDLVVYGDWSYGLTDIVPDTITIYGDGHAWRDKVQRMDDFVFFLQIAEMFENMGIDDLSDFGDMLDEEGEEEGEEEMDDPS